MSFFKNFFSSLLAVIIGIFLFFFLIIVIVAGVGAATSQDKGKIKSHSVLEVKLDKPIVENAQASPLDIELPIDLPFPGAQPKQGLYQMVEGINQAKDDKNIDAIYLNLTNAKGAGWSTLRTLRKALNDFKTSGKPIYAYANIYSEKSYYIASTADKVCMPAVGMIEFNGIASSRTFLTGLFEKLEVEPKIFKVGTYKSAVEPFFLKEMSEANRTQTLQYVNDIWNVFLKDVAESREMGIPELDKLAGSNFIAGRGSRAKQENLVDELWHEGAVLEGLKELTEVKEGKDLRLVSLGSYSKKLTSKKGAQTSKDKIAVIFAEGEIRQGKSQDGVIGSASLTKAIRKARQDDKVKAIVLRVNSPGGDALASDLIAEEIKLAKLDKPVIASMGDVAASGGYYISAPCDYIYADENTITGSIGIFGMFFQTNAFFNNKLGITFDQVETHEYAGIGNPNHEMTEAEAAFIQGVVNEGYGIFLDIVKEGRNFADSTAVDKVAQGRVWSGTAAKSNLLVDEFGGLQAAIDKAAAKAGLEDYKVQLLPKAANPLEEIMSGLSAQVSLSEQVPVLKHELQLLERLHQAAPQSGMYTRLPYWEEIK